MKREEEILKAREFVIETAREAIDLIYKRVDENYEATQKVLIVGRVVNVMSQFFFKIIIHTQERAIKEQEKK